MTQCNQRDFGFAPHFSRQVVAGFEDRQLSTEGGALLLRETDRKIGLLAGVVECFRDHRAPERIEHELRELLAQRIYGLALGYEDLNDHEELRRDPLLTLLAGKRSMEGPLAGKSTLNRLELTPAGSPLEDRYHKITYSTEALDALLVNVFLKAHAKAPRQIVLDVDVTDTPLHGEQQARFFHGYYSQYCYLPLYIFCGDHLLCARQRPSNQDASAGSREEVERIVKQIRQRWPKVRIILRADSGFCREELMAWCPIKYRNICLQKRQNVKFRTADQAGGDELLFPITRQRFFQLFRQYAAEAGIPKHKRSPHKLKHSIAKHLI